MNISPTSGINMKIITEDKRPDLAELLILLQEEAAEVSQAASKLIRFGLTAHNPKSPISNLQELSNELTDLLTIIGIVIHEDTDIGILRDEVSSPERVATKLSKISQHTTYWSHAKELNH